MTTLLAAVEGGHRFVGRPGLHLEKVCARVVAFRAVDVGCLLVLPRVVAAEDVGDLLRWQVGDRSLDAGGHAVDVGARAAFQADLLGRPVVDRRVSQQGVRTLHIIGFRPVSLQRLVLSDRLKHNHFHTRTTRANNRLVANCGSGDDERNSDGAVGVRAE